MLSFLKIHNFCSCRLRDGMVLQSVASVDSSQNSGCLPMDGVTVTVYNNSALKLIYDLIDYRSEF